MCQSKEIAQFKNDRLIAAVEALTVALEAKGSNHESTLVSNAASPGRNGL
jgi:hypothetical protein